MRRKRNRLPIAERIRRLKNHFHWIEHYQGNGRPPPVFDLNNRWDLQTTVIECY